PSAGGEIIILDGTYSITAKISVTKNNVNIKGNGNSTVLKRMWDSTANEGIINLDSVDNYKISDFCIDGNDTLYPAEFNYGIYARGEGGVVTNNICKNSDVGIFLSNGRNNTILGNMCYNNVYGIYTGYEDDSVITNNKCASNTHGITLNNSNNNTILGNVCNHNAAGIDLSSSSRNVISGNTCTRGTGLTSDYIAEQYTIALFGTNNNNNLISSNMCLGKAVAIGGGTSNTSVNNKFE
ncbi:MAG: NosD domain-containing protein, partial [Clostridia bacterium]|nr:NosD domain-containing protein [Clostridia bacterium]